MRRQGHRRKRGLKNQAIGRSKGGMTTKILALTDALGNLVRFVLLPGHRFDTVGVAPLIEDIEFDGLIADKAFDSNWINVAQRPPFPSIQDALNHSKLIRRYTNGGI
jgi:hypothetical protein